MKNLSEDTKTYASLALFRKMKEDNVDILDVVESLAVIASLRNKQSKFSKEELSLWTYQEFGFEIPDGAFDLIVKRRRRFVIASKKPFRLALNEDFDSAIIDQYSSQLADFNNSYSSLENDLFDFLQSRTGTALNEEQKAKVRMALYNHILEQGCQNEYTPWVLQFILYNENKPGFSASIDNLLEGLLIYIGLNTNSKEKNLDSFSSPLTLILDTEILFHISGYHGDIFQRRVNQFIDFIEEVNRYHYSKSNGRIIKLKYLPSTRAEITRIFTSAEDAKRRHSVSFRYTMVDKYLNVNFDNASDIAIEQDRFWKNLHERGIKEVEDLSAAANEKYELIKEENYIAPSDESEEYVQGSDYGGVIVPVEDVKNNLIDSSDFDDVDEQKIDSIYYHLIRLNEVYALRGGDINDTRIEKAKYVLISDTAAVLKKSKSLAKEGIIKKSFHLAESLSAISVVFWLKLNKGLSSGERPLSYDILAKTRCSLANLAGETLRIEHKRIHNLVNSGKLSKDEAARQIAAIREFKVNADEFDATDDITLYISEEAVDFWHKFNDEKLQGLTNELQKRNALLENKDKEIEALKAKAEEYRRNDFNIKRNKLYDTYIKEVSFWETEKSGFIKKKTIVEWRRSVLWGFSVLIMLAAIIYSSITENGATVAIFCFFTLNNIIGFIINIKNDTGIVHSLKFLLCSSYRTKSKNKYISKFEQDCPKPVFKEPVFQD